MKEPSLLNYLKMKTGIWRTQGYLHYGESLSIRLKNVPVPKKLDTSFEI